MFQIYLVIIFILSQNQFNYAISQLLLSLVVFLLFTDCLNPPTSTGATVSFTFTTHGSTATYTCDYGYAAATGDDMISCDAGAWTGTPLSCTLTGDENYIVVLLLKKNNFVPP